MNLTRSNRFVRSYVQLSVEERRQMDAHLRFLAENPRHPSLRARRWSGSDLWYARVNRNLRLFYRMTDDDNAVLVDVGHHDIERST